MAIRHTTQSCTEAMKLHMYVSSMHNILSHCGLNLAKEHSQERAWLQNILIKSHNGYIRRSQ